MSSFRSKTSQWISSVSRAGLDSIISGRGRCTERRTINETLLDTFHLYWNPQLWRNVYDVIMSKFLFCIIFAIRYVTGIQTILKISCIKSVNIIMTVELSYRIVWNVTNITIANVIKQKCKFCEIKLVKRWRFPLLDIWGRFPKCVYNEGRAPYECDIFHHSKEMPSTP